jgi:hypothetical protein
MWYKRTIPLLLVLALGLLGFAQDYVPHPWADSLREEVVNGFVIIGGFALFIGAYSLLHMHVSRIRRRQQGWGYSAFVFLGAAIMIVLGMWAEGSGPLVDPPRGVLNSFQWCYEYILVPCNATIFSLLAFFIASAAFRTFRVKNFSAFLLLAAALIVMFGRVPVSEQIGEMLFGSAGHTIFPDASELLLKFPNTAAKRAILLGVSLGAISQSLRILFGIERTYMGGGD